LKVKSEKFESLKVKKFKSEEFESCNFKFEVKLKSLKEYHES